MRNILEARLVELRQQFAFAQSQVTQLTANVNAIGGAIQLAEQVLAAADEDAKNSVVGEVMAEIEKRASDNVEEAG